MKFATGARSGALRNHTQAGSTAQGQLCTDGYKIPLAHAAAHWRNRETFFPPPARSSHPGKPPYTVQDSAVQTKIMLLKRAADLPSEDVMRTCVFQNDSCNLAGVQSRRCGRPRKFWAVEVYRFVENMAVFAWCSLDKSWLLTPFQWQLRAANFCFRA